MEDDRENCAKYIQLIQSVWAESRACTLYASMVYRQDFRPISTGPATLKIGAIPSSSILRAHLSTFCVAELLKMEYVFEKIYKKIDKIGYCTVVSTNYCDNLSDYLFM